MENKKLKFEVLFEQAAEGGYTASVPTLPGCISEGETFEETIENIQDAISLYLESLIAEKVEIPQNNTNTYLGSVEVNYPQTM